MHTKRFLCFYLFLVSALCAQLGYGQNLTITDSGETGISGTNWSISGNILTSTENASIHPRVIEKALDLGDLSIQVTGEKGTILVKSPIRSSKGHVLKLITQSSIQVYESIEISGGEIYLSVTDNQIAQGSICIDGDISVASASGQGGNILLEAKNITLSEKAVLTATGPTGGGNILVGGDWQGGASIENRVFEDRNKLKQATKVSMHAKAIINASATENGNGGTVVLWSDIKNPTSVTKAHGTIFAKGGSISGDGGMIETSGSLLETDGIVISTESINGKVGLWLLDPVSIFVGDSYGAITSRALSTALNGSNITLSTNGSGSCVGVSCGGFTGDEGNIFIGGEINKTSGTETTLKLIANNDIFINAPILDSSGTLNINLEASREVQINQIVDIDGLLTIKSIGQFTTAYENNIDANSGILKVTGGGLTSLGGDLTSREGDIVINGNLQIRKDLNINSYGNNINITGDIEGIATSANTYTSDSTFNSGNIDNIEILVVAGGGAGGWGLGGGGGAGGYIYNSNYLINNSTNYSITVGEGGVGPTSRYSEGSAGEDSLFGSNLLVAKGGGRGASHDDLGTIGGSGAGGSTYFGTVRDKTSSNGIGQGNEGGNPASGCGNYDCAGGSGGGGALTAGGSNNNGNGGNGISFSVSGTSNTYSAGGGGAANGMGGSNGIGGNGDYYIQSAENAPKINTGSGGGGMNQFTNSGGDYSGGSDGIIIVRYKTNGGSTFTLNTGTGTATLSGVISGGTSIIKNDSGTLILEGNNTYSGSTNINGGTLKISHSNGLGNSSGVTTVSNGATLQISGDIAVSEPITINGSGISSNGAIYFESGNNTYSGAITLGSNSTITSAAGNQTISGTTDGGYSLSITDAGGHWYHRGVIGGTSAPTSLNINGGIVDLYAAVKTSGAINVLASDYIYIEGDITITDASQNLYFKAVDEVNQREFSTIQTNGGNVVFWANSDGDTEEWDLIKTGKIDTDGGHVWLGGSLFNNDSRIWNGLTVGSGYAYSSIHAAVALRGNIDTRTTGDSSIGGDVWIAGEAGSAQYGDIASEGAVRAIYAGNGDIALITHSFVHQNANSYQTNLDTTGQISIAPASGMDWNDSGFTFNYILNGSWFEGANNVDGVHINSFSNIGGLNLGTYNGTGVEGDTSYVASNDNSITISNGITINGPISIYGEDITLSNSVTASGTLLLQGSGATTQSAAISATTLSLQGSGTFTLNNSENHVEYLAAGTATQTTGNISFTNKDALIIGDGSNGIRSTGTIQVGTLSGNLTLANNISTDNITNSAIKLYADQGEAAGSEGQGNIIISGTPSLTTGSGGTASLYSGKPSLSTGLAELVGDSNIKTNVDATSTFDPALSSGVYALFRTGGDISNSNIADIADLVYTGSAQTVSPTVTLYGYQLTEDTDYTTSFEGNTNAGTATITLTGIGNYTGTQTKEFTITSKTLTITAEDKTKVYDGSAFPQANYSVTYDGFVGDEGTSDLADTLAYTGTAIAATVTGTYVITPSGLTSDNYSIVYEDGELSITQRDISEASIADIADLVYTGSAQTVSPEVTFSSLNLVEDTDYTTSFEGNTNAGTATITLTGIGNYTGTKTQTFTITSKTLTITAEDKNKVYDGSVFPQANYSVTYDGFVVGEDKDNSDLIGTIDYGGTAIAATASGTYVITPSGLTSDNYSIVYEDGELSITQRDISEASIADIADLVYTGSAQTVSPEVTFSSLNLVEDTDYTTSFEGNTNAGTATITLTGIGNYTGTKTQTFTITSKTLTITAEDKNKVYDGSVFPQANYSVTYDGFVVGEDKDNSDLIGTIDYGGTAIAATASGTYVITPSGLTSDNYSIVYEDGVLSITQKPITIAITDQTKVFGASDPSPLNAHTISVGSVYGQTPTGVFTRTLGEDVGIYTIGKGDLTYGNNYIETFVNGNLSITARTITVTAAAKTKVYGESDPPLTYIATPLVGDPVVAGSSSTVTFTGAITRDAGENAGTYSITLGTLTNTNYTIDYVGADFTITKAPTAIEDGDSDPATETLSDTIITFGDSDILLTPTSSNTADYTFTSSDSSVASITTTSTNTASIRNMGVGSAEITISQGEDANYQAKTVSYTLTVNPLPVTVTPTATQSKTYGELDTTINYTTSPNGALSNSSTVTFTGTLSRTAGTDAGTYSITIGTLTNTNYALTLTEVDYTINKRPITISAEDKTKVYGVTDPSLTHSITAGSIVSGDSETGVFTRTAGETAGTYTITQNTLTYGDNYDETYEEEYLTITNATVTLTVLDYTKVYNKQFIESSNLSFTATGLVNGDTIDSLLGTPVYTVSGTATNTVGTYSITLSGLSHPSYNIEYVGANATITPATLTITADTLSKTYGDADPELTHTTIGLISGDTPTGTLTRTVGEDVGTYTISNDNLTYGNNYIEVFESGTLTITTKAVSVTANAQTKVHGYIDPELTYSVSPAINTTLDNNTSTITFTGSLTRTLGEDVGTYAIGIGTLTNTNFDITFTPADLTITKLPVVITPTASQSKTYGEVDPTLTYTTVPALNSTLTNTTSTVTFTGSLSRTTGENIGDYTINIGTLTNTNYDITLNSETFAINKKTITASLIGTVSKTYNGTLSATLASSHYQLSGFVGSESATITQTMGNYDTKNVGTNKEITVSLSDAYAPASGTLLSNYALADTATGTVGEIILKSIDISGVTASDKQFDNTTSATVSSSTMTYTGLIGDEVIEITPSGTFVDAAVGADKTVNLTYSFSGAASGNYTTTGQVTTTASILANDNVLDFDGSDDYIRLMSASSSAFDLGNSLFTIEFNIKFDLVNNAMIFSARNSPSGSDQYQLQIDNGKLFFYVYHTSHTSESGLKIKLESINTIEADKWYHIAIVRSANFTYGMYINGENQQTKSLTTSNSDDNLKIREFSIGNYYTVNPYTTQGRYFDGQLDEFRLWTEARSLAQIQDNINKKMPGDGNLVVYYSFDQGVSGGDNSIISNVLDTSGPFNLTMVNFAKSGTSSNFVANTRLNIKVPPTLTLTGTTKVYGDADFALSLSSTSTGTITYTTSDSNVASIDAATGSITITGVGTTTITATQTETAKYTSATVTASVYVAPKPLSFTGITASDKVYDGTTTAATATDTLSFSGLVGSDEVLVSPTGSFENSNVGVSKTVSLTYTYSGSERSRYTITGQATTTASITAKPITIIPTAGQSKTYGLADATLSYTISPSTLPNGTAISLGGTLSRTTGENVGTYSITIGTVSDTNYEITLSTETFEITKKTITVSGITASDKVYDANTTASVDLSGITFDTLSFTDTITATVTGSFDTKDIGTGKTVALSASYSSTALDNYTILDQTTTTASITARTVSVTGDTGIDKTFDNTTNLPLGAIGYGVLTGVLPGEDVALTGVGVYDAVTAGVRSVQIGTVTLTGADKGNYVLNWTNGSGTIAKKTLTVTANNDAKFVGETDTTGYNGVSYSGFEGADSVADINVSGLAISRTNSSQNNAGSYPGTLVPSGVTATNYTLNYVGGDYTIIPADKLLLRVSNQTTTYGTAASYAITSAQYFKTGTGLVNLSVPTPVSGVYPINDGASTINIEIVPDSPVNSSAGKLSVGSYGLAANVVSGSSGNFSNNIEVIGNHSVVKQSLTASASSVSKEYDATTAMAGVRLSLAILETADVVTVNGTGSFSSPLVGTGLTYTIAGLSLSGTDAGNYYLSSGASFSGNNGEITKAPLTITANDDNGVDTNPAYSGGNGVTYQGFKGSDSEADLSGALAYSGTSQGATAAGSYAIEPTGITSSNYSITFVAGTLTIIVGDSDGDGVRDPLDNCPTTPNADQADADGDGIGDVCDNAPNTPNADQADSDGDGIADAEDNDDDNDGVPDSQDAFPTNPNETTDSDGDGQGDNLDTDIDNDGVINTIDNCIYTPNTDQLDTDADGIGNACDNDDDNDGYSDADEIACGSDPLLASSKPLDTDGDGIPNCLDDDDDNDGYSDSDELGCDCACEDIAKSDYSYENSDPLDATSVPADEDKDGIPDCFDKDKDNDGVLDEEDAFPLDKNEWTDSDADGIGNNADEDDDNDGQLDVDEIACGSDPLDNASLSPDFDQDNIPDCVDQDSDNDGVLNSNDAFPFDPTEWTDTDLDGIGNNTDQDDDNDGYSDLDELECNSNPLDVNDLPGDLDQDGIPDCKDNDIDGDGCINTQDVFPRDPSECSDADGDGLGDNIDIDSDNDGIPNTQDAFPLDPSESKDADGDGIGDNADPDDNQDGFDDEKVLASGVLTPNSSGLESTWKIINLDKNPNARVAVYSKNGLEVFSAQGYRNDWRGTYKNSTNLLPAGSYYYVVELNTGEEPITGWLYITY